MSLEGWDYGPNDFIRAAGAHKELKGWTTPWLARIGALWVAHRAFNTAGVGGVEAARAETDLAGVLAAIDTARKAEVADETLHLAAKKVLARLDHEWEGPAPHAQILEPALDNNASQRAPRDPVVPNKNCYGRRRVAGVSRFLILPHVRVPNLASHILAQAVRRLRADRQDAYGDAPVLLETFVDALNWR